MARVRLAIEDPANRLTLHTLLEADGHTMTDRAFDVTITDGLVRAVEWAAVRPTLVLAGMSHLREAVGAMLETALQRACEEVYGAAVAITGEGGRMGTTMDALLVVGATAFIAHVGDGRIYLQRGHEIHQLTEDHSLVQQQVRDGVLTQEQARKARFKNVITRALGVFPSVLVDTFRFDLDFGDRLLICTDGMYRYLGLTELGTLLSGNVDDKTVSRLIALALERGGRDNITAVVCTTDAESTGEFVAPTRERMEVLRKAGLFQYCTYRELMVVCQITEPRTVPAGTVLFRDGDEGTECFIVEQGSVAIDKRGTRLAVYGRGDYFGEMSFIDAPARSADAIALEETEFLVIHRDRFLQMLKQDSELAAKLMWQLLRKLSRLVRLGNDKIVAEAVKVDVFDQGDTAGVPLPSTTAEMETPDEE